MNYKVEKQKWLDEKIETNYKEEILSYTEEQSKEAFGTTLEFGTGGLRAIMGAGTNKINKYTIQRATLGFAKHLSKKYPEGSRVAIAYDPRNNSELFSKYTAEVLGTFGIKVYIYQELMPTPLLSYAVRELDCQGGIMLTASHNPKEYNGYKVYDETGGQLNIEDADNIISIIDQIDNTFNDKFESFENLIAEGLVSFISEDLIEKYLNQITVSDKKHDTKIVFSPLHGTSYKLGIDILNKNGFQNIITVKEQMTPDGNFTNAKSANPEESEAFDYAEKYLVEHKAEIAILTDPDADRVGIMANDVEDYKLLSGNQVGALLTKYLIDTKQYLDNSILYKTIVTGEMGAILAKNKGIEVEEVLTGFKFIGERIRLRPEKKLLLGYEESYGYLLDDCVRDKDAIQGLLHISLMTSFYQEKGKTLFDVLNEIYSEVGYYVELTKSIALKGQEGLDKIKSIMNKYHTENFDQLYGFEIESKIDYLKDETGLPSADVIKYYLKDLGWIVYRPSGTEPKIKLYISVKTDSIKESNEIVTNISRLFEEECKI